MVHGWPLDWRGSSSRLPLLRADLENIAAAGLAIGTVLGAVFGTTRADIRNANRRSTSISFSTQPVRHLFF